MDRNSFLGLVLIGAILIIYSIYSAPTDEEMAAAKAKRDAIEQVENIPIEEEIPQAVVEVKIEDSIIETHSALSDSIADLQQNQL